MASADVAYLLSFSIIMLNTDLHNPNIKEDKKMTLDDFIRNNRNYGMEVSAGRDLPNTLLKAIYDSIMSEPIRTLKDGLEGEITPERWRDLILQGEQLRDIDKFLLNVPTDVNAAFAGRTNEQSAVLPSTVAKGDVGVLQGGMYGPQLFIFLWPSVLASLSSVLQPTNAHPKIDIEDEDAESSVATTPELVQMALDGFFLCARISAQHGLQVSFHSRRSCIQ